MGPMKPTILAMYSGGLDSLGMVYKLLTETQYADYRIHIHHVHNKNIENRHRAEAIAVEHAIRELQRLGYEFVYSESEIGTQSFDNHFMFDTDSMNFFAGYVASVNPDIAKIAIGMQAHDANHSLEERRVRANKILSAFTDAEKIYPVMDMSKREIYDMLPPSLRDLFWSCRVPQYSENTITSCGRCNTCRILREQGIRK
jgi:7-cyano-7-deazaguanine synthase in queuosine biosynthesis